MKKLLTGSMVVWTTAIVSAQGTVNFANTSSLLSPPPDRLVRYDPLLVGTNPQFNPFGTNNAPIVNGYNGHSYRAQLYYGASTATANGLVVVSIAPRIFRSSTSQAGAWLETVTTLDGFLPGDTVNLQVRVWDIISGAFESWEAAVDQADAYTGLLGESSIFQYTIPTNGSPANSYTMTNFQGFSIGSVTNPIIYGPVTNFANGHLYFLLGESTWPVAEQKAVQLGGHLATVNDAAEQTWIMQTFGSYRGNTNRAPWIGLNDQLVEGQFVWSSGEPLTYTNWAPNEPNNAATGGGEDCGSMWPPGYGNSGQWNDLTDIISRFIRPDIVDRSLTLHGVVEVNPIPPYISSQPTNQTVVVGGTATLSVVAGGTIPLSFRWSRNGTNIPTGTNASLTLADVQPAQAGSYSVVVANLYGSVTSSNATLTIVPLFRFNTSFPYLRMTTNGFQLQLDGLNGISSLVLYASTNLMDWEAILTNPPVSGSLPLLDAAATNLPTRFYRAEEK